MSSPIQYPYNPIIVVDGVTTILATQHNQLGAQLQALTARGGGTWDDDLGRPVSDINNPYPYGYNKTRIDYEYWDGAIWHQWKTAGIPSHAPTHGIAGSDPVSPVSIGAEPAITPKNSAFNKNFGSGAANVCVGDDSRLSDDRTPNNHDIVSKHTTAELSTAKVLKPDGANGVMWGTDAAGSDELVKADVGDPTAGYLDAKVDASTLEVDAPSHKMRVKDSGITDAKLDPAGHIGDTSNPHAVSAGQTGAEPAFGKNTAFNQNFGTGSGDVCEGNDARLSDARTPLGHSTSHKNGGGDEVATATPAVNAIPKADASGILDSWIRRGSFHQTARSEALSATAGATPVPKLNLTTPSLPAGTYKIQWFYEVQETSTSSDYAHVLTEEDNGGTPGAGTEIGKTEISPANGSNWYQQAGFDERTLGAGVHRYDISFWRIGGGTINIRKVRMIFHRVS